VRGQAAKKRRRDGIMATSSRACSIAYLSDIAPLRQRHINRRHQASAKIKTKNGKISINAHLWHMRGVTSASRRVSGARKISGGISGSMENRCWTSTRIGISGESSLRIKHQAGDQKQRTRAEINKTVCVIASAWRAERGIFPRMDAQWRQA